MNTMTTEANIPPQSPVYRIAWIILNNPTATGLTFGLLAKIIDMKYSFQIVMKLNTVTVIIPGCTRGNMILQKVPMGEQPSIYAASSYVELKLLKNESKKNTVKGTFIAIYKNINSHRLFVRPRRLTTLKSGMTIMIAGIPNADANKFWIEMFPLNLNRLRTYAAGEAMRMMEVQATTV